MNLVLDDPALADFRVAEYGTRRRFSKVWHEEIVSTMKARMGCISPAPATCCWPCGTAMLPLGTMDHEYLQACQALGPRLRDSQVFALEVWAKEYRGDLGIALSDVYGMDAFLRDFDVTTANCSTARATIRAIRSCGASGCSSTTAPIARIRAPRPWCSRIR